MANETQKSIGKWVTTEIDPTLDQHVKKLKEEVSEFVEAYEDNNLDHAAEELADVLIVAFGIAFKMGFSLLKKVNYKMLINRTRTWQEVDGVARHV